MTEILTRRDVILLAACAATQAAIAQSAPEGLSVTNSQGVRIVPYGPYGNQSIPALSVLLPGRGKEIAVVVEMPEHAWRKRTKADEPEWFYRMYTNDTRLKGTVQWTREKNTLNYRMSLPSGVGLNAKATLDADGLGIEYHITNPDNVAFTEVQAPTCIKLYHPFTDVFLERTYVHHAGGLDLLASETPERLAKNAEEWLPCRYIVRCAPDAVPPAQRVERQSDGITIYRKLRAADTPFLATESSPKGWVAATHSLSSPDVWTNPARTCHHADSGAPLNAKGMAELSLKLYLLHGGVKEAWNRVGERDRRRLL